MANYFLKFDNVAVEYYGGYSGCGNVNFAVRENSLICLLGEKNSGKTSLLKAIGGLEEYSGSIQYDGRELKSIAVKDRDFALTMNKLPKHSKVHRILGYPLSLRKFDRASIDKRVRDIADSFGIFHLLQHTVSMLTAEQKVLVELARVFIVERRLYLIDNPLEGVYITERTKLAAEIIAKIKSLNKTVIYATDRLEEVAVLAPDKTVVLCYNQMQDEGDLHEIAIKPKSLAVAKLMWQDMVCVVGGEMASGRLIISERDFGASKLIDDVFLAVKCLVLYDAVAIVESGLSAEVIAVYKYIDKTIIKAKCDLGDIYIKAEADNSLTIGDSVDYSIDKDKLLIYDSNSEKLISR